MSVKTCKAQRVDALRSGESNNSPTADSKRQYFDGREDTFSTSMIMVVMKHVARSAVRFSPDA